MGVEYRSHDGFAGGATVMMGRQRKQTNFADIQAWMRAPVVAEDSFYGRMARFGERLVREEWFREMYSDRGRPSVPPVLLSKVLLLMFYENLSDRQAEERARYDLRWKVALGLGIDETGFDSTSLCRFRARLVMHGKERRFFEETVRIAREYGLIKAEVAEVIDSTAVLGAGAVQDTYNLLKSAIRKVLKVVKAQGGSTYNSLLESMKRNDYNEIGKPEIDWDDKAAQKRLLNDFVHDARAVLKETEGLELDAVGKAARELLAAVAEQDIEEQPDGTVKLKDGVARDRVISTTDPEMRHGRKSSKGRFDGYKAHVMEEPEAEVITGVAVTAANVADAEALPEMLGQQKEIGITVSKVTGDTAYGSGPVRAEMLERGIKLIAPVPPEKKGEFLPKSAFEIDLEGRKCRCPAGHVVDIEGHKKPGQSGLARFGDLCETCPLRYLCTKSKMGRAVAINRYEELIQQGRAEQETEVFKLEYRQRPIVERKIAELVRHGMRKARYIGKVKVLLQLAWTAAVVNIKR
ncbi:MAG: IS1182 family transposase, partial [Anaerolineae bacterium]